MSDDIIVTPIDPVEPEPVRPSFPYSTEDMLPTVQDQIYEIFAPTDQASDYSEPATT